ncbi:MATE family efflux transporter [Mycobacterium tuberculosis]|uniref:MATE family efflux transporter n=1 Tax=Mycobacterium tuberculosis TaxID=1773 RepID=UPI0005DBFD8A|nr:MATE family efflux transporter [Mycobacterium tuberculosis]CEJ52845.1 Multidrug transporter MatE [Mycobacterium tuberculosis variant caprae]
MSQVGHRAGGRQIAQLALPALGVLAAEPLYLLFDIAVVGRLGAISLAGLAIGSLVLGLVGSQATFLSYGTTARAARRYGAGNRVAAVTEGVQATWLALGLGALVVVVVEATATPLVSAIASGDGITAAALPWLRIAILGTPAILVSLAGNGWLRGVQDTVRPLRYVVAGFGSSALLCPLLVYGWLGLPRWGLTGSAVANLVGQWLAALLFAGALLAERVSLRPDRAVLGAQLMMARDLIVRTLAFQVCYVSAAAVAARFGAAALAAHQVVLQLWGLLALGLGSSVLPGLFTDDRSVLAAIGVLWWFMVVQLPFAGIVFAVDGVLLGAGDAAFMRTATVASALVGFLPLVWLSLAYGWGLAGIWSGLGTFIVLRLIFVGWRAYSGRWAVTGAA